MPVDTVGKRTFEITASLLNFCQIVQKRALPEFNCRMFVRLTKQTSVKCNESEVCFPATILSNWSDFKNGKKSWKNLVIAREAR